MPSKTNEAAFEAIVEKALVGTSREERQADPHLAEPAPTYTAGYRWGTTADFDPQFALDTAKLWQFLETTQADELKKLHPRPNWRRLVIERIDKLIKRDSVLALFKKPLEIDDAVLTLFYSPPVNEINPLTGRRFRQNIFSVTRQIYFRPDGRRHSVDMVLFINGLPVVTIELKNAWTGQAAHHARKQYKARDPHVPLFTFGRCVVHFAVDTDEAYMTTHLRGADTVFLPFNKGHNHGKGNPPNKNGHRTAYLWEEVLQPLSLANILEHFVLLTPKQNRRDALEKQQLFFPRYHQLDVVRKILDHARRNGTGHRYLIEHSAGSGKSNSITWAAYQLIELYRPGADTPLFDSVIVVTDRRVLDRQLSRTIGRFAEVRSIVGHAQTSANLKQLLERGKKIIITTIQKFPYIFDQITDLSRQSFAVLIDEAHSSQSGKAADNLNMTLEQPGDDDPDDVQDIILRTMAGRKMSTNASYFAFTATPKEATLEKFGTSDEQGKNFRPFHLYSMKQAIEEGFILDVLANYTTYKSYYEITKAVTDNPEFSTTRAQKKLRKYVEAHRETIAVKAAVIADHFIDQVAIPKLLKGQAKGMVVTADIVSAIRYFFAVRDRLAERNASFQAIVAFSGRKQVDGIEYTEQSLNGFATKDIEDRFDTADYRLLVVANKFLTGFDQPKLTTMYVDKRLRGVRAVQTLSRLNRSHDKLGKRTEDVFVLDFYNTTADIEQAFSRFYTATTLREATDVNVLHDLKDELGRWRVYHWPDVEEFNRLFFGNADADRLSTIIDPCAAQFNTHLDLDEDEKADFKIKAKQFVKLYSQVAGIIRFDVVRWEKLFWFLKFLIPKLIVERKDDDTIDELLNSVDLSTYGLERKNLNEQIDLDAAESELDPTNAQMRGVHDPDEQRDPLDEIVDAFNERWFKGWDAAPEKQKIKLINIARHVVNHPDYEAQVVNNPDPQNSEIAIRQMIKDAVRKERRNDLKLYKTYATDTDFERSIDNVIIRIIEQGLLDLL